MGMNKKQREAAARLAEATPAVTPVVEQPIAAEQQAVAAPVAEPAAPAEPVAEATPAAKPVAVSKQSLAIMRLVVKFKEEKQIEVTPEQLVQDGKFINVVLGDKWPVIRVGPSGGYSLPEIASYKEGIDTMVNSDALLAKKLVRQAKAAAAIAPAAVAAPAEKKEEAAA